APVSADRSGQLRHAFRGTVNLSNPRAIFAGSRPRFTPSRVTYEAYVVSRTSTRPQVDSALATLNQLFPVTTVLPPGSYLRSDLIGNLDRRVGGVGAAGVDVDDDIVFERQRASTAPAGGTGILFGRDGAQYAVRVGDLAD